MTALKDGFVNSLWNFFCSLKLTIFLLIGLAAASVVGTVVPQNAPPEQYLKLYSETTNRLFSVLNFYDMYHSWWFILLLYSLTLNLVACSLKRLPRDWKMLTEPVMVLDEGLEKSLALVRQRKIAGSSESLRDRMEAFLRQNFAAPRVTVENGEYHLFAQKCIYSRVGVYFLHFSIIIIFIGALIGSYFGYKAFVSIEEGTGTSTVYRRSAVPGQMEMPEQLARRTIDLGFIVRCDKFSISYYDNGAPKEYKSVLSIIDNGRTVVDRRPVIVNDPLTYKGITFYQSSYSPAGAPIFHISVRNRKNGAPTKISVRQGESASLADGSTLQVLDYTQEVKPFIPQANGPAVRLMLTAPGGQNQPLLLLRNYPDLDADRGGDLIFTYDGIDEKWSTGLQVTKDPGVWVVWLGCTLLVAGIFMAFFLSHRRIWIRVENGRVTMGGVANKNQAAFRDFFERIAEKLHKM